jgi:hypothetical protein
MANEFKLKDLTAAAKVVTDFIADCMSEDPAAADGKIARDVAAVRRAAADILVMTNSAAGDSDPVLDPQERKLKGGSPTQEVAKGDKRVASDSRGIIYNIDSIFGGSKHDGEGAGPLAPSLNDIFGGSKPLLGEG